MPYKGLVGHGKTWNDGKKREEVRSSYCAETKTNECLRSRAG